jgi:hypothetical protein
MPLALYTEWIDSKYARDGRFAAVRCEENQNMRPAVHDTLVQWSTQHRIVGSMLYNLAGNGILRDIVEQHVLQGRPYDEWQVMNEFLNAWLARETQSSGRPSSANSTYLDLYLKLLEDVATRSLLEGRVDDHGYFVVRPDDVLRLSYAGQQLTFPVQRVLHRSGLKVVDPRVAGEFRYRFEPVWMHRLLVDMHQRDDQR